MLTVLAFTLAEFPPGGILDWAEGINQIHEKLELAGKISTYAIAALCILYLGSYALYRKLPFSHFGRIWNWVMRTSKAHELVAFTLIAICSFSFTATRSGGSRAASGPLEALAKDRAEAIQNYRDLVWNIRLESRQRTHGQSDLQRL